jgi:hypothetical protein
MPMKAHSEKVKGKDDECTILLNFRLLIVCLKLTFIIIIAIIMGRFQTIETVFFVRQNHSH